MHVRNQHEGTASLDKIEAEYITPEPIIPWQPPFESRPIVPSQVKVNIVHGIASLKVPRSNKLGHSEKYFNTPNTNQTSRPRTANTKSSAWASMAAEVESLITPPDELTPAKEAIPLTKPIMENTSTPVKNEQKTAPMTTEVALPITPPDKPTPTKEVKPIMENTSTPAKDEQRHLYSSSLVEELNLSDTSSED
jgi:hypothetical protein